MNVVAFIVPQGKIVDFIDGALRNETPEDIPAGNRKIARPGVKNTRAVKSRLSLELD